MKIENLSNEFEECWVLSEKKSAWTLSDLIAFLQKVEELGYGQYYVTGGDPELSKYYTDWVSNEISFHANKVINLEELQYTDFPPEGQKLLEENNGRYFTLST